MKIVKDFTGTDDDYIKFGYVYFKTNGGRIGYNSTVEEINRYISSGDWTIVKQSTKQLYKVF